MKKSINNSITLPVHTVRKISLPEDVENNRVVYSGHMLISSILELPTHENVRGYLVEAEGKQRRTKTQVHVAIQETLKERPSSFSVLNGGVTIVAKARNIDDKTSSLTLTNSSIINGSQTQGVIKD